MAVPEQTPYKEYVGNGVTTNFALEFTCNSKQELKVFINDIEPELSTWSLTSGSVSFTTAPTLGSKIVLKRATKLERTTNYSSVNNSFRPETINKDFDRIWYAIQEQNYKAGQYDHDYNFVLTQVRPINTGGTGANNVFNARSNLDVYSKSEVDSLVATGGEGNVVGVAGGGTGATTVAEARTNLGVMSSTEVENAINSATPQAAETAFGVAKIATTAIAQAGTNDTDFLTAKKLRDALNASGDFPVACFRSYGYIKTSGATVTLEKQLNIASVVRIAVGTYTITFTKPMPNTNYLIFTGLEGDGGQDIVKVTLKASKTVNGFNIIAFSQNGTIDGANISFGVIT